MLIDSHAHLDMDVFERDLDDVLKRASAAGIEHIVSIGIDRESSLAAISLARKHGSISASVGCHPHHAEGLTPGDLKALGELAGEPQVVAWGEIGLDFYRNYASQEVQLRVFEAQLGLALDLKLPVIVHIREAHEAAYRILKGRGKGDRRGVIHCFSGDVDLARAYISLGYFISIPGTVTYPKATQTREVAASIPLDRILIETDAPYLAPVPMRGKRNEPAYLLTTAREVARLRGVFLEEVARRTTENARFLFGLGEEP